MRSAAAAAPGLLRRHTLLLDMLNVATQGGRVTHSSLAGTLPIGAVTCRGRRSLRLRERSTFGGRRGWGDGRCGHTALGSKSGHGDAAAAKDRVRRSDGGALLKLRRVVRVRLGRMSVQAGGSGASSDEGSKGDGL